jgi:hypothetical protein
MLWIPFRAIPTPFRSVNSGNDSGGMKIPSDSGGMDILILAGPSAKINSRNSGIPPDSARNQWRTIKNSCGLDLGAVTSVSWCLESRGGWSVVRQPGLQREAVVGGSECQFEQLPLRQDGAWG